ncbi:sugar transferase [Clostridium perfringens]|uniref:sugar transferase n=1 Tax=Clostridium perfringens TaxID=1502 RepID=UPI0018D6F989|nr:sugar transferase [Clostridium perfringens]EGS5728528.1 sugar transferase [Clostridium perfringens]MDK0919125.1 sugar transferase [Clostridium perfringens]MDM0670368.1 sugar transferase [Clostridium perfringens]MDM0922913.1 sugar transferase [Clostridium perfringens]MDV5116062.1 sugar transferase [Clostridium perfringens]
MYKKFGKRLVDILLSIPGLILLGILIIPISILIYLEDKGPIFYNGARLGKNGDIFYMYKFRSMKVNAPDIRQADGSTFNSEDDPRLTKVGKFLRKTSLDEAPQVLNVFKGDMSVIGPRPDLPEHKAIYVGNESRKLEIKPGISGYSQAYFRNSIPWKEKIQNDIYYIDNMSFTLDVKIFIKTAFGVLKSEGIFIEQKNSNGNEVKNEK